jgi:hypothetical protein
VFANIYLNELDRFVKHRLKVQSYLRYGDDFVLFGASREIMEAHCTAVTSFLSDTLRLTLHAHNNVIFPCERGLFFLGCRIFAGRKYLKEQVWHRVLQRADLHNVSSYHGLVRAQDDEKILKHFDWHTLELLDSF